MAPAGVMLLVVAMFYLIPSIMILMGIFSMIAPRMAWSLRVARGIKGIEPTAAGVVMTWFGGLFLTLFASVFLAVVATLIFPITRGPVPAAVELQPVLAAPE